MRLAALLALGLLVVASVAQAGRVLPATGRAVYQVGSEKAVVLQAEGAARLEYSAAGKTRVFIADLKGMWEVSQVGAVPWRDQSWGDRNAWVTVLLQLLDPASKGIQPAKGVAAAVSATKLKTVTVPAVTLGADARGVSGFTVGSVAVRRTEAGPLPGLAADTFKLPKKQSSGLAALLKASDGATGGQDKGVSATAGARGVTTAEKQLGSSYSFEAVERIEATTINDAEVDAFIRAGKLGGGS